MRSPVLPAALVLAALPFAAPAAAQEAQVRGLYVVARGGASIDPEQKFDTGSMPASATFSEKTKYKTGVVGEIGAGYDFGVLRVEQTIGYTSSNLKLDDAQAGGFVAGGRTKAYGVGIAAYVDIPVSRIVVPYLGGGIGASRVEASLLRVDARGIGSSYAGKDWGFTWHGDAGLGFNVLPRTTLEVGGRYAQTGSLRFAGQNAGTRIDFQPRQKILSATVGIRHVF